MITSSCICTGETRAHGFGHVSAERRQPALNTDAETGGIPAGLKAEDALSARVLDAAASTKR